MPPIIIILIIVLIAVNTVAKARKTGGSKPPPERPAVQDPAASPDALRRLEEAQRRAAARPSVRPAVQSADVSWRWRCSCGHDNAPGAAYCTRCGRGRAQIEGGSLAYDSAEGMSLRGGTEGYSTEGRALGTLVATKSSLSHMVRPSSESSHTHAETSLTGYEPCPEEPPSDPLDPLDPDQPYSADAYALGAATRTLPYGIDLHGARSLARGVLYAEILAKPKALRR